MLSAQDQRLIESVSNGDVEAFAAMVREHVDGLVHFAEQHVSSSDAAEDIVQDIFLGIWTQRERWTVRHSIKAYLFGAVRRRILTHRIAARRDDQRIDRLHVEDSPAAAERLFPGRADAALDEEDLRAAYERGLTALPERCRQVFLLQREHRDDLRRGRSHPRHFGEDR